MWPTSRSGRLYPRERPGTHCAGGWVGTRAGLDGCRKSRPPPGFHSQDRPARTSRYTDLAIPVPQRLIYVPPYLTLKKYVYVFPQCSYVLGMDIRTQEQHIFVYNIRDFILNRERVCLLCVTNLLTYLLTPRSRVLLEKLTGSAASQEIPRIFVTRRFLTVFTSARHLSLS